MRDKQTDNNRNERSFRQKHGEGKRGRAREISGQPLVFLVIFGPFRSPKRVFYVTLNKAAANELKYQNAFENERPNRRW